MSNNTTNNELLSVIVAGEQTGDIAQIANIAPDAKVEQKDELETPIIPDEVYSNLPDLLKRSCGVFTVNRERDVFLTAALSVFSGLFNNVTGVYDQKVVFPNLFALIVANAASGKGTATFAKQMAMLVHKAIVASGQRTTSTGTQGSNSNKLLFTPANSSYAALIKHLEKSGWRGIIFETETDTLTITLKQDWAGYSDLLRKAFHHEPVTYSRKQNDEYIEIDMPQLSILLTGTPGQVAMLMPSAENGLFSRFLYYRYSAPRVWKDVSPHGKTNLTEHFNGLSKEVLDLVNSVNASAVTFDLSGVQWDELNTEFAARLERVKQFYPDADEATSSVFRLGLITFRIAMLLTVIRAGQAGAVAERIQCSDVDFRTAMTLSGVYLEHAMYMMETMPKFAPSQSKTTQLYAALPNEFGRAEANLAAVQVGIKERMTYNYIEELIAMKKIERTKHGKYRKME